MVFIFSLCGKLNYQRVISTSWCKELTHLEKTLMLGKIEGRRQSGGQRIRWLDGIIDSMDMSMSQL